MSTNDYRPHIHILPEDDANRQVANGFILSPRITRDEQIQILPIARGWSKVRGWLSGQAVKGMRQYSERYVVGLVDFDGQEQRREQMIADVPEDLRNRVFLFGVWSEPEQIKADFRSFERLGTALAESCDDGLQTGSPWNHELLKHNLEEFERARQILRAVLFS